MSKPNTITWLASILHKAQGRVDIDDRTVIHVGEECDRIRNEYDKLQARVAELEKELADVINENEEIGTRNQQAALERVREILRRLDESEMADYPKSIDDDIKHFLESGGGDDG